MAALKAGIRPKIRPTNAEKPSARMTAHAIWIQIPVAGVRVRGLMGSLDIMELNPAFDEGNRTERVVIGLGAGRTQVKADVQVYEGTGQGRQLIEEFETDAKSAREPGRATFVGPEALAGYAVVAAATSGGVSALDEKFRANVEADTERLAKDIAKQLKQLFIKQGWMSSD